MRFLVQGGDWHKRLLRKSYLVRYVRKSQLKLTWLLKNRNFEKQDIVAGVVEETPDINELTKNLLIELNERVANSGGKLTLFAVPSKSRNFSKNYNNGMEFSDKVKNMSLENDIDFIDLTEDFKLSDLNSKQKPFFEKDIHFNEFGHTIVAKSIKNRLPDLFQQN